MRLEIERNASIAANYISRFLLILNHKLIGFLVFVAGLIYMADKSFVDQRDHLRMASSFILLTTALGLILYSRNRISGAMGFVFILAFIFFPFYWRLQGFDTDGFTIAGVFPQNDAKGYFIGALKILYGQGIPDFAARRPLFSGFLAVLLYLTQHNFIVVLLLLALIAACAIYLWGIEIRDMFGAFPAAIAVSMMAYSYIGKFQGKLLTEQLGLPLGLLSFALLLRGMKEKNLFYIPLAILILSVGLNARAGALFVLPFLFLWWIALKGARFSRLAWGAIVFLSIALGFVANLLFRSVSMPGSVPFSNFGDTIYGMATGYRGWRALHIDYPDLPSSDAVLFSVRIIAKSPSPFLHAVLQAYREFLQPARFFSFLYLPDSQMSFLGLVLAGLLIIGLIRLVKIRQTILARLLFGIIAGILVSIPFVPPIDDGVRAMIVTNPVWALLVGLSFANLTSVGSTSLDEWELVLPKMNLLLLFSLVMVLSVTMGWLLVKGSFRPIVEQYDCDAGERPVALMTSSGSYANIVKNSSSRISWLPNLHRLDVRSNAQNFSGIYSYDAFSQLDVGYSVLLGLNLADTVDSDFVWLIVPTNSIQTLHGINYFCVLPTGVQALDDANYYVDRDLVGLFQGQ